MLLRLIDDMNTALDHDCYFAALAIALPFGNFYANVVYGSGKAIEEKAEKPAERP